MFRRMRYKLPRNERTAIPSLMIFFDTETVPYPTDESQRITWHKLRLWAATCIRLDRGMVTRRKRGQGTTAQEFWDWVNSCKVGDKPIWLFAHNLAFDLTQLRFWHQLESNKLTLLRPKNWRGQSIFAIDGGPRTGMLVLNDPPTIIECWQTGTRQRLVLCDTLNWFRCRLAELGEELGLPKMPMPPFDATDQDWLAYCENDVAIVEKAILALVDIVRTGDLGNWRYTVSSQAMAAFKHRFMKHEIELHRLPDICQLEREGYFGGDVRLGFFGNVLDEFFNDRITEEESQMPKRDGPVYVYDVQSFYPSVMHSNVFPTRLVGSIVSPSEKQLRDKLERYLVIARVHLDCKRYDYPLRKDGRVFPSVGNFTTTLCSPELERALHFGHIKHIGLIAYYDMAPIFKDFVDYFWTQRRKAHNDGRKQLALLYKLIMNSLPGKFGQRQEKWTKVDDMYAMLPFGTFWAPNPDSGELEFYRSIIWEVQKLVEERKRGLAQDSFPAIAAFVTSYGRERMFDLRNKFPREFFLYQDTDSLHVLKGACFYLESQGLVREGELGYLSLKQVAQSARYRGIKYYQLDGKWTIAGLKTSAIPIDTDLWEQDEWQNLSSIISEGPKDGIRVRKVTFDLSNNVLPGKVDTDGTVHPHEER